MNQLFLQNTTGQNQTYLTVLFLLRMPFYVTAPRALVTLCIEGQCHDDSYATTSCGLTWLMIHLQWILLQVSGRRLATASARRFALLFFSVAFVFVQLQSTGASTAGNANLKKKKERISSAQFCRSSPFDRQIFWQRLPGSAHQGCVFQPPGQAVFSPQTNRSRYHMGSSRNHLDKETSPLFGSRVCPNELSRNGTQSSL